MFFFFLAFSYALLIWGACAQVSREANLDFSSRIPLDKYGVQGMVEGKPIEKMLPYISVRNKRIAAYLVAIAKKESDWGRYAPKKDGRDCYNYWGYRGTFNQTDSGYSCFNSPRQAVRVVGDRIRELAQQDITSPEDMVVWKCGRTCATHSNAAVRKWINDVDYYYGKVYN